MVEAYLSVLETGYDEVKEAFEGLADENVWKRPAEGLLSIGEMAGHIAYWETVRLASENGEKSASDPTTYPVSSPLIDRRFRYYSTTMEAPPSERHRAMTAEQVCGELLRVHAEAVAHFQAHKPDLGSTPPGWSPPWTYDESLKYAVFHVAYHTGQMYSARHLLGEPTPDN